MCSGFLTDDPYDFANSWAMKGADEPCKRVLPPSQSCNSTGESAKVRRSHAKQKQPSVCLIIEMSLFLRVYACVSGSDVTVWGHEQLCTLSALCSPRGCGCVCVRVRVWCLSLQYGRWVCVPGHAGIRPHLCQSRHNTVQLACTEPVLWVIHTYSLLQMYKYNSHK